MRPTRSNPAPVSWLGWQDSDLRMSESKSDALPLGYSPPQGRIIKMGWMRGLEPPASRATIWRANQLRHTHHILLRKKNGAPGGTRTPNLLLRRQLLYPAELQAHITQDRLIKKLEQVMGIEPTCSAWKADILPLNYTRIKKSEPEGIRTPDPRLRRPLLYPAELRTHIQY